MGRQERQGLWEDENKCEQEVFEKGKWDCYITSYPVLFKVLYILKCSRQKCSFEHHHEYSGKYSVMLLLIHKNYLCTYIPQVLARYSFSELSELEQCGENKFAKTLKHAANGFKSEIYRLRVRCSKLYAIRTLYLSR